MRLYVQFGRDRDGEGVKEKPKAKQKNVTLQRSPRK